MRFYGFYNFKGGGTEQITGQANEGLPSSTDNISNNPNIFFTGQFSNLSRRLIHVGLHAFRHDGSTTLHKHDIRAYESLNLSNIPLQKIDVYVESDVTVGFHGMGVHTLIEDDDERAVALTKSDIKEEYRDKLLDIKILLLVNLEIVLVLYKRNLIYISLNH